MGKNILKDVLNNIMKSNNLKKYAVLLVCGLSLSTYATYSGPVRAESNATLNLEVPANEIITGTADFDTDDQPGNDSSETNDIVRTNDILMYSYKLTVNNPAQTGKPSKVQVKTTISNAFKGYSQGVTIVDGTTKITSDKKIENIREIEVPAGSVVKGRIAANLNSNLPNGQKIGTTISARVISDDGQALTDWTDVQTKDIKVSSRLNVGVRTTALDMAGTNKLYYTFDSLKNKELGEQIPVLLYVQTEAKSFRPDSSMKGVYTDSNIKVNFDIEKTRQDVRFYKENGWKPSGSSLRFENLGGTIQNSVIKPGVDEPAELYKHDSFAKSNTYFAENSLDGSINPNINLKRINGWSEFVLNGYDEDSIAKNKRDVVAGTIYKSGKMDINSRTNDKTVSGSIVGMERANQPLTDNINGNKTIAKNYYLSRGYEPLSSHIIVTNAENDYDTKNGKLNPNHESNSVKTTWKVNVKSIEYDGQVIPTNESSTAILVSENAKDGTAVYRTAWEDLRTRDAFGEFEIGDDWNNHFGASSTFAGDLTSVHVSANFSGGAIGKVHRGLIKLNPDAATLYEGDPNIKALGYPDNVMQPASVFDEIKRNNDIANGVKQIYPFLINRETGIGKNAWFDSQLMRLLTGFTSGWGSTKHINDLVDFRFGVKKNTNYSLDELQAIGFDGYDWYDTYEEAKKHGIVSAFDYERKQPDGYLFRFSTPLLQLTSNGNGTNIVNGNYAVAASNIYEKQEDGSWKQLVDGAPNIIPAKWSKEGILESPQSPSRTTTIKADTIALKPAIWKIRYNDKQSDLNIPDSGEIKSEWLISAIMGDVHGYNEQELKTVIHFPKGVSFKEGSAYLINKLTGEKVSIEPASDNDVRQDRDVTFKLPTIKNDSSKEWILGYDLTVDQSLVDLKDVKNVYKSGLQYASVYWSDYPTHPDRDKQTNLEGAAKAGQAATYSVTLPIIEKTSIIDEITPKYGELNSDHVVTVRPYSTVSGGENGVSVLIKIPTTGYHGSLTLNSIESTNNQIPYDVFVSNSADSIDSVQNIDMSRFTEYKNTPLSDAKYVLIKLKGPLNKNSQTEFKLHMSTSGNRGGDVYSYSSQGNTDSHYKVDYQSNVVETRIIERDLSGVVWEDSNKNGLIDEGEKRFANKEVELLKDDNVIKTVTTDDEGFYKFAELALSGYKVRLKDYPNSYRQFAVTQQQAEANNGNKANNDAVVTDIVFEDKHGKVDVDHSDYHNIGLYKRTFNFKVTKNWVGANADEKSNGVTVDLMKDNQIIATKTISNDTNWETMFEDLDLDDKDKFTVLEHDITGFKGHTRYDIDGDNRVAKITNIKIVALPNTGGVGITLLVIVTIGLLVGAYVVHRRSEH